jgi:hypothetical protein
MKQLLFILAIFLPIISISAQEGSDGCNGGKVKLPDSLIYESELTNAIEGVTVGTFVEHDAIWAADSAKVLHFADTSTTGKIATKHNVSLKANTASPTFTGTPVVPGYSKIDSTTNGWGLSMTGNEIRIDTSKVPTDYDISLKQNTLTSGTTIKTINSTSLLGSGNITITGGSGIDSTTAQRIASRTFNDSTTSRLNVADIGLSMADSNITWYTIHYLDSITTAHDQEDLDLWAAIGSLTGADFTAPTVDSISLGGLTDSTFICFFDTTDLHQDSIPLVGSFSITEEGHTYGVNNLDIIGDSLIVTMDSIAHYDSTYLMTYTRSLFPQLQDSSGNEVATFTNHAVTNYVELIVPSGYPDVLLTNTVAWYKSTEGITTDVGVRLWADQSGNSHTLEMETDASQPSTSANGVLFDGSADEMMTSAFDVVAQPIVIYEAGYLCE